MKKPQTRSSPLPPRAKRVAGRGRGWGVLRRVQCQHVRESSWRHPPPPTSRASSARLGPRRFAEGGEKNARMREPTAPPASAEIPQVSFPRRSARSTAPSGRRGPSPAVPVDVHAATSRATRTSAERFPGAAKPLDAGEMSQLKSYAVLAARSRWPAHRMPDRTGHRLDAAIVHFLRQFVISCTNLRQCGRNTTDRPSPLT